MTTENQLGTLIIYVDIRATVGKMTQCKTATLFKENELTKEEAETFAEAFKRENEESALCFYRIVFVPEPSLI